MKQLVKFLFIAMIISNQGCNIDCGECFTPPAPFLFEIVDKATGENLFTNGTYESADIQIINTIDNTDLEFTFTDENDVNIIQIHPIGWITEKVSVLVKLADKNIFNLYVDAERVSENCCSFTRYNEIKIENSDFELDIKTGIYKIHFEE